jgi:Mlc titration factor MtfA (ptsG expression regulator)
MSLLSRFRRRPAMPREELVPLVRTWLPAVARLQPAERENLFGMTDALVAGMRWEAANGFEVTDDMRVAVSANAALLVLGLDDGLDSYLSVTSVIIHPSTIELRGTRSVGAGMFTDHAEAVLGEAHHDGPVLVAWDAASYQARHPHTGENVLFHEFAHRLDMLDGVSDGTPPIADPDQLRTWADVCTRSLTRERASLASGEPGVLREYATTNPTEFFSVATEEFFTRGARLRELDGPLYGILRDYYRQDPAGR